MERYRKEGQGVFLNVKVLSSDLYTQVRDAGFVLRLDGSSISPEPGDVGVSGKTTYTIMV